MATLSRGQFRQIATDQRFIEEISELILTEYQGGMLNDYFNVVTGIKGQQDIVTIIPTEYISHSPAATDPSTNRTFTPADTNFIKQTWDPRRIQISRTLSWEQFSKTFSQWLIGNSEDPTTPSAGDVVNFIVNETVKGMVQDTIRICLFGGSALSSGAATSAKNGAGTNVLTDATKVKEFNQIAYGLIETAKHWRRNEPALKDNFINIDKNQTGAITNNVPGTLVPSGILNNEQYNLSATYARDIFRQLVRPSYLDIEPDILLCSSSLYYNYTEYLEGNGVTTRLQSDQERETGGSAYRGNNQFRGVPIQEIKRYDTWRAKNFTRNYNAITTANKSHTDTAHFALYARKDNLQVGIASTESVDNLRIVHPDAENDLIYIKGDYYLDFKFVSPLEKSFRVAL